ncbi:helix-turn-helix transcriptional regulator [Actinocrinis sp.]|uniref:helix-turn-helix transcriptional regulator n=1 Tax=Actinocrinis sp. TaxID=1920516 RepID=UPI0039C8963C
MISERRRELGMRTQQDLADAAGTSVATITRLESGRPLVRRSWTWAAVEQALDWPSGYLERYMRHRTPPPAITLSEARIKDPESTIRRSIKDALQKNLPDVTVSQALAAENAVVEALIRVLREEGVLASAFDSPSLR